MKRLFQCLLVFTVTGEKSAATLNVLPECIICLCSLIVFKMFFFSLKFYYNVATLNIYLLYWRFTVHYEPTFHKFWKIPITSLNTASLTFSLFYLLKLLSVVYGTFKTLLSISFHLPFLFLFLSAESWVILWHHSLPQ